METENEHCANGNEGNDTYVKPVKTTAKIDDAIYRK